MRLLYAGHDHDGCAFDRNATNPSEDQIKHALEGNICRCTGYVNIVESVKWASEKMRKQP